MHIFRLSVVTIIIQRSISTQKKGETHRDKGNENWMIKSNDIALMDGIAVKYIGDGSTFDFLFDACVIVSTTVVVSYIIYLCFFPCPLLHNSNMQMHCMDSKLYTKLCRVNVFFSLPLSLSICSSIYLYPCVKCVNIWARVHIYWMILQITAILCDRIFRPEAISIYMTYIDIARHDFLGFQTELLLYY